MIAVEWHALGPRWLVFAGEEVSGLVVWDQPQPGDAAQVLLALPESLAGQPKGYYIDARRRAKGLDPGMFSPMLGEDGPARLQSVERCAIVVPSAGELAEFFTTVDLPFDIGVFED